MFFSKNIRQLIELFVHRTPVKSCVLTASLKERKKEWDNVYAYPERWQPMYINMDNHTVSSSICEIKLNKRKSQIAQADSVRAI